MTIVTRGNPRKSGPPATGADAASAYANPAKVQPHATRTAADSRGLRAPAPSNPIPVNTSVAPDARSHGATGDVPTKVSTYAASTLSDPAVMSDTEIR